MGKKTYACVITRQYANTMNLQNTNLSINEFPVNLNDFFLPLDILWTTLKCIMIYERWYKFLAANTNLLTALFFQYWFAANWYSSVITLIPTWVTTLLTVIIFQIIWRGTVYCLYFFCFTTRKLYKVSFPLSYG